MFQWLTVVLKRNNTTIGLATLLLLLIFLASCSSLTPPGRKENNFESAYIDMAYKLQDVSVCYKIYPKTYWQASWSPKGHQVGYLQSECLFDLAVESKNPYFCNDVVTVSTATLDGSAISKDTCLKEAEKGEITGIGFSFDSIPVMKAMGYTEQEVFNETKIGQIPEDETIKHLDWYSYYLKEVYGNRKEFRQRINKLPNFKE